MSAKFDYLQNLSTDQLVNVPIDQIMAAIQEASEEGEDQFAVLEFAFTQFVMVLSLDQVHEVICQQFLPALTSKFDEIITYVAGDSMEVDTVSNEFNRQIQTILHLFLQLINTIEQKLNGIIAYNLLDIQLPLLSSLHFSCAIIAQNSLYINDEIKHILDAIQSSIGKMLASPKLNESVDDLKLCQKVLRGLVELGHQQLLKNDLQSMANSWKHVRKLSTDFHSTYRAVQQQHPHKLNDTEDFFEWITFSVNIICDLITNYVDSIGTAQFSNSQKQMEIVKKTTSFYVKLLQYLAKEYANDEFRGHNRFIQLYQMIVDARDKYVGEDFKGYLSTFSDEILNILSNIFNSDQFSNELLCQFHGDHIEITLELAKLLLKQSITHSDRYLNPTDIKRNIFHHLLSMSLNNENARLNTSNKLYCCFRNVTAALMLLVTRNKPAFESMEQALVEATFNDNAHHMPVLVDIWTAFLRHLPSETRLMYCNLLLNVRQNMASIPRTPSGVLVQVILKSALALLSESERSQLIPKLTQNDSTAVECLHFNQTNGEVSKRVQQVVDQMNTILTKLNPKCEIVTSSECVELINGLAFFQLPPSKSLLSALNNPQFTDHLNDALFRSKARTIDVLVSTVIRVLLWQQYLSGNCSNIDCSDSSDVRKFYALQVISVAQLNSDRQNSNIFEALKSLQNADDLISARIQKTMNDLLLRQHLQESPPNEYFEYFSRILSTNHHFGCTSLESCSNQNATFKRSLDQILNEAKKLERIYNTNQQINLQQFSSEIRFVGNLLNRMQNDIR